MLEATKAIATFVILLERDSRRVKSVRENVLATLPECQVVPAVDGALLDMSWACRQFTKKAIARLDRFKLACLLSHLAVVKKIVEERLPHAIIFEDDVKVPTSFHKNLDHDETPFLIPGKRHIRQYSYTYCNVAYLVSLEGARKLVSYLSQPYDPCDFMINDLIKINGLKSYMTRVNLVHNLGQLTDMSDNQPLPSNIARRRSLWDKVMRTVRG